MKIVGLITEYNPFHNGHLYHLEQALDIAGADAAIAVMSGNYVQRGAPAIMPKRLRTKVALEAGVSIVLELPVCWATGSAEYFAAGAVSLLERLGCVDAICFGSECGDFSLLDEIAKVTADEPQEYQFSLQEGLRNGMSFPLARQMALKAYFKDDRLDLILEQPNNILGIEYLKALHRNNSPMKAYTIQRKVSGYHDTQLSESCSSASAIRRLLEFAGNSIHLESDGLFDEPTLSETMTRLEGQVPPSCIRLLEESYRKRYPVYSDDFSLLLKYQLMKESRDSLVKYQDVSEELANRIMNCRNDFLHFDQFCGLLKTKELTYSRISRSLFHILLHITRADMLSYQEEGGCPYARILGFRKDSAPFLSKLKRSSQIPLVTKLSQTETFIGAAARMIEQDIFAADLYESVITDKYKLPFISEYQQQIVRC